MEGHTLNTGYCFEVYITLQSSCSVNPDAIKLKKQLDANCNMLLYNIKLFNIVIIIIFLHVLAPTSVALNCDVILTTSYKETFQELCT